MVHITDVLAVSMMLGITAQVKEAGIAWDKGEKKSKDTGPAAVGAPGAAGRAQGPSRGQEQGGPTAQPPETKGASGSGSVSCLLSPSVTWAQASLCPALDWTLRGLLPQVACRYTVILLEPFRPRGAAVLPEPDRRDPAGRSLVAAHGRALHQQTRPQGLRALVRAQHRVALVARGKDQ